MGHANYETLHHARETLEQQLLLDVMEQALSAQSGTDFLGFENIVGVGISDKMVGGQYTGKPCVSVYVVEKVAGDQIAKNAIVPKDIKGVPTDVIATGELYARPLRGLYRPAPCGVSVGHYNITAGTLGCVVTANGKHFILSNNHVLANSNAARVGDPILQPGPTDGGLIPGDVIANLSKFIPINFSGVVNKLDCAIAEVVSQSIVSKVAKCYGQIGKTITECSINLPVKKCGRTTDFTQGKVTDCNATVRVNYDTSGTALFQNQIIIVSTTSTPFSKGGDSGSLIVTETDNNPVGLLFAGSTSHTIANPISAVLSALNVTIET